MRPSRPKPPKRPHSVTPARPKPPPRTHAVQQVESPLAPEQSLLDLVDNLLNQGVVLSGEAVLGVAGVDLVYLRLQALLCAADKLVPQEP